ncbi:SPOR domain-containing protein [Paracoccus sp. AK26]|uniref:SPOR domain-containing protein n=1 Tax=Paracoccus sp. AK26 TaxID=2589076 RepID=UPI001428656E|nr:SPOR domain-containing protein [Paracoccus sp. AK26]QIR85124.1 hypothetical protein FIU66_07835 [Paracoccus sp. AK26]
MWVLGLLVMVLLLPGQVRAAPEPPPPGDFPGAQYIDRTGCVFVREAEAWLPRLDKAGTPICGFPPSKGAETGADVAAIPSPEEALADMLAEGLRAGDLASGQPAVPLPDVPPDPEQAVLDAQVQDQLAVERRMRSLLAGPAPKGLCESLGYRPADGPVSVIGGDVTQGLCPGMTAPELKPVTVAARKPQSASETPLPEPVATARRPVDPSPVHKTGKAVKGKGVTRRPAAPQVAPPSSAEVIPANARYVEIGTFTDQADAQAALRTLSQQGFRTAQRDQKVGDKAGKAILAGPFADRQALVRALNRLRANGFPRSVAR